MAYMYRYTMGGEHRSRCYDNSSMHTNPLVLVGALGLGFNLQGMCVFHPECRNLLQYKITV